MYGRILVGPLAQVAFHLNGPGDRALNRVLTDNWRGSFYEKNDLPDEPVAAQGSR